MKKLFIIIIMLISILFAETRTLSPFDKMLNKYKVATNYHKALAVAIDSNGGYASGYSFGKQLESHAIKKALTLCNKSKAKHHIISTCRIYMINNKIVGTLD